LFLLSAHYGPLAVLPDEVWLHHLLPVLSGMLQPEGLRVVMASAAVCRHWRQLALDGSLWREAARTRWGPNIAEPLPPSCSRLLWAPPTDQTEVLGQRKAEDEKKVPPRPPN
jgi:hypothetical protein